MGVIVQKYGGSSVADVARIQAVAARIAARVAGGAAVAVVVSAMGDTTDDLIALAQRVHPDPAARELDLLMSTGETVASVADQTPPPWPWQWRWEPIGAKSIPMWTAFTPPIPALSRRPAGYSVLITPRCWNWPTRERG